MNSDIITEDLESRVILLMNWRRRAIRASNGHYLSSSYCRFWSNILILFNIISAIAVLFFSNNKFFNSIGSTEGTFSGIFQNSDILTAIAGLFVVLTTAIQYVLKLEIKSRDAKSAGNDFTNIKRNIEIILTGGDISTDSIQSIQISHTHTSRNHELVPKRLWSRSERKTQAAFAEDREFERSVLKRFGLDEGLLGTTD